MPRQRGSSTERGYGSEHQAIRARLLRAFRPGQPCARCGYPIASKWMTDPKADGA